MQSIHGSRRNDLQWPRIPLPAGALTGRTMAVIGGTNGIGRALARTLAEKGAEVFVVGRTFRDKSVPRLHFLQANLAEMKEARRVAPELPAEKIDTLIFTNGIFAGKERKQSSEGIEVDLAVSYLSRFVILRQIAGVLGSKRPIINVKPRVFVMGFPGTDSKGDINDLNSDTNYNLMTAHMNGVIGNEALVLDGASRYPEINFYGLNPGAIKSNIRAGLFGEGSTKQKIAEWLIGAMFQSAEQYSDNIVPMLLSDALENYSGTMFNSKYHAIHASKSINSKDTLRKIMDGSEMLSRMALGSA